MEKMQTKDLFVSVVKSVYIQSNSVICTHIHLYVIVYECFNFMLLLLHYISEGNI